MNRPIYLDVLTLCISICLVSFSVSIARGERWEANDSEAEVYTLLSQTLLGAELSPSKIKRGSYPLFRKGMPRASLPLLSAPCPLLTDCESLINTIRSTLLDRGYHLVYSDQKSRDKGPMHFAVARGQRPVVALRLFPSTTTSTLFLHLSNFIHPQLLMSLNPHLTYILSEARAASDPQVIAWLDDQRLEYILKLDDLSIKRALLDQTNGDIITEPKRRRGALYKLLSRLVKVAPNSLGFYIDQESNYSLDRATLDELVSFCARQHRVLVLSNVHDELPRFVAQTMAVRSFMLYQSSAEKKLSERLRSLETMLVLDGDSSAEFVIDHNEEWETFTRWLKKLEERDVSILRLSEVAY